MKNFHTYQLALQLFRKIDSHNWRSAELTDQVHRASMSIVLNIAEGYGRRTAKDRRRFYFNALGSLREVQAAIELAQLTSLNDLADHVGACLYKLTKSPGSL